MITIQVVNWDDSFLSEKDEISTCNNFLHSCFQHIEVTINNQVVSSSNNDYMYQAYFEAFLSYNSSGESSYGPCSLFYRDTNNGKLDDSNIGYAKRKQFIKKSQAVQLIGKLRFDLASQTRYILNDTSVNIALTRSPDNFCLLFKPSADSKTLNPKVKFLDASFFVRKQQLYTSLTLSHQKLLMSGLSAQYPMKISDVKTFTIPKSNQSFVEENIFRGSIPNKIVLALVSNEAHNGSYETNPFVFDHFNLNYLALTVNNIPIPIRAMNLDFNSNQYMLPYYLLLKALNVASENDGIVINREDYARGNTIYAFDLHQINTSDTTMTLQTSGSVRVELKFSKPLDDAVTLICYSESESILSLDKYRQVSIT